MAGETRKGSVLPEVTTVQDTDQLYLMRLSETLPQQRNKRISLPNLLKNAISTVLKFTQAGAGAVERTVDSKLKEAVSVKDFGETVTSATVTAAANFAASQKRTLRFPDATSYNFAYSRPPYNSSWEFDGIDLPLTVLGIGTDTVRVSRPTLTVFDGNQPNFRRVAFFDKVISKGADTPGPARAVLVREIENWKEGWGTGNCNGGEIGGMNIAVRNDRNIADNNSYCDSGCMGLELYQMEDTGFSALIEGYSQTLRRNDLSVKKSINVQLAPINEKGSNIYSYGLVLSSTQGSHNAGIYIQSPDSSQRFQEILAARVGDQGFSFTLEPDGTVRFLQKFVTNNTLRFLPNGKLAIGGNGSSSAGFSNQLSLGEGTTVSSFLAAGSVVSTAIGTAANFISQVNVSSNVNLSRFSHFEASWGDVSATNVSVGAYIGIEIPTTNLSNVFGVRSNLPNSNNRWNVFCSGTAPNYMRGNLHIGHFEAVHPVATGTLGLATGTEPANFMSNSVQLYSIEDSPGNTMLGLRTQGNQPATESLSADRSVKVRINGVTYKLLLKAI